MPAPTAAVEAAEILEDVAREKRHIALQSKTLAERDEQQARAAETLAREESARAEADMQKARELAAKAQRDVEAVAHEEAQLAIDMKAERQLETRAAAPSNRQQGFGACALNELGYAREHERVISLAKAKIYKEEEHVAAEKKRVAAEQRSAQLAREVAERELAQAQHDIHEAAVERSYANASAEVFAAEARQASEAQVLAATAIFKAIDSDGNGQLSVLELHCKLADFGLGEPAIEQLFSSLDTNHDGNVSLAEWTAGYAQYHTVFGYHNH